MRHVKAEVNFRLISFSFVCIHLAEYVQAFYSFYGQADCEKEILWVGAPILGSTGIATLSLLQIWSGDFTTE
jgi:hypothetical protein